MRTAFLCAGRLARRHAPLLLAALAVAVAFTPELAHAQAGGAGQLGSLVSWAVTNVVQVLLNVGVLVIAAMMLLMRVNLGAVAMVAIGGLIFANYTTLAGLFA